LVGKGVGPPNVHAMTVAAVDVSSPPKNG
jgi:hypothetical protein